MDDSTTPPQPDPGGAPRLLTLVEAAAETGLSRKALARRIERGTLRAVHDHEGRRVVPRAELDRAGLLDRGSPAGEAGTVGGSPGGEVVIWQELYEREREQREAVQEREVELRVQLAAIANAGPIRALRLRRALRASVEAGANLSPDG
jgi:hypothetical protein